MNVFMQFLTTYVSWSFFTFRVLFFFLTLSNYFGRNKFIIIKDYGDRTDNFERRLTVERLSLVLV